MRNIHFWNQAAVGKLAWHLYSLRESLWVKWVHGVYTKGGKWEIFNAPATASWTIKKLSTVTNTLKPWICRSHYSIKEVYEHIMLNHHKVPWRFVVWNRISIPKTRFVCWLGARQGLKTKDKLFTMGVVGDDLCPLCGLEPESTHHLFFKCKFSRLCAAAIKSWIGVTFKHFALMDFRKHRLTKVQQHIYTAIYACTVYHIWQCRNEAVWHVFVRSPENVISRINHDIKQRCYALKLVEASRMIWGGFAAE